MALFSALPHDMNFSRVAQMPFGFIIYFYEFCATDLCILKYTIIDKTGNTKIQTDIIIYFITDQTSSI